MGFRLVLEAQLKPERPQKDYNPLKEPRPRLQVSPLHQEPPGRL